MHNGIRRYRLFSNYSYWREKYLRVTRHVRSISSAITMQCAMRIYMAKKNVYQRGFARVIVCAARVYLCRQIARQRKEYLLRSLDIKTLKRSRYEHRVQRIRFNFWWLLSSRSRGLEKASRTWNKHKMQIGFKKLWAAVVAYRNKKERAATLMNSVVRRFVDQKQVLNYAKFSRGLRRMQAKVRGQMARKQFDVLLYLHAMATKIQKIYRGWKSREDLQ